MDPRLTAIRSAVQASELTSRAASSHTARRAGHARIAVRPATAADVRQLDQLARRSATASLADRNVLVAEQDARILAALSLTDERLVVDPAQSSEQPEVRLRACAAQLRSGGGAQRSMLARIRVAIFGGARDLAPVEAPTCVPD